MFDVYPEILHFNSLKFCSYTIVKLVFLLKSSPLLKLFIVFSACKQTIYKVNESRYKQCWVTPHF